MTHRSRSAIAGLLASLLLCAGCQLTTSPPSASILHSVRLVGDVMLSGSTKIVNDTVVVAVVATNNGADSAWFEFGACSFRVRAQGTTGVGWGDPAGTPNCPDLGYSIPLAPGETREWVTFRAMAAGIRVPHTMPTRYMVRIYFRLADEDELSTVSAGAITL